MSRVFIIQNVERKNRDTGQFEPMYDFTPAEIFGEHVFLLDHEATPTRAAGVMVDLMNGLTD